MPEETKLVRISYSQYGRFMADVWPKCKEHQRFGQAFFNFVYMTGCPCPTSWPELFYEKDNSKAQDLIKENTEFVDE